MNIFEFLHKSIFSGDFYKEVIAMRSASVAQFFFMICLASGLFSGVSRLYYAMDVKRGLAAETAEVFQDLEIQQGRLIPHRPVPYVPDNLHVLRAFELISCLSQSSALFPDSLVMVDTAANAERRASFGTALLSPATTSW